MKPLKLISRSLFTFLLLMVTVNGLTAQQEKKNSEFVPHVGQAGKDVIWVPTPDALVQKMLEIAKVTPQDFVVDLGSGDGRTVIAAAKKGANAVGIEFNKDMVELSKKRAEEAGVNGKATFLNQDLFDYDLSKATVITMFLLPDINLKLRPKILDLKPGTRVVSNTFTMGEWRPDLEVTIDENSSWNTALMWIVPAKVEGKWKLGKSDLSINQEFQRFYGTLKEGGKTIPISDGKIDGSNISFKAGNAAYTGKVINNNSITGTLVNGSTKEDFSATKTN
ncbi:MAG TPA: class I SAM-dependent methyltransferase [Bacteroidales bacterium]|nr:class I SAM-dependent methyltransferase [Bacteroidales bacterium]